MSGVFCQILKSLDGGFTYEFSGFWRLKFVPSNFFPSSNGKFLCEGFFFLIVAVWFAMLPKFHVFLTTVFMP